MINLRRRAERRESVTGFELIKGITGVREFADVVFGLATNCANENEFVAMLSTELDEEQLQHITSEAAEHPDYPLSFEGIQ